MPRYAFRVPAKGGRTRDNIKMVGSYAPGTTQIVVYIGTESKARKLAAKQNDASWFLGEVDENDKIIKK